MADWHIKLNFLWHLLSLKGTPSLLAITETKLSPDILDCEIANSGYDIILHDHNRQPSGAAFDQLPFRTRFIIVELLGIKNPMPCKKICTTFCVYQLHLSVALWLNQFFGFFLICRYMLYV